MTDAGNHLYLVDGSSYIFRAFFAVKGNFTRSDGTPTNAVYGFTSMLLKLLQDLDDGDKPSHVAVIFDAAKRSFRNDIYEDYKAHRPDPPEELIPQFSLIRDAVRAFNVPCIEMQGYEADDIIATYASQADEQGWKVTIISSDKDLMQLVNDRIGLLDTMKNVHIGADQVREKFGVGPDKVIDVQALAGDSTDNVPGVPGIGIKTAADLINEYGDLEGLLEKADEIKQPKRREKLKENADLARISRQLVTLKRDVPVEETLDSFVVRAPDPAVLLDFIDAQEFKSLRAKAVNRFSTDALEEAGHGEAATDTSGSDERDYECVTSRDGLDRWISRIRSAGIVAVDTETTNILPMKADLVGISLAVEPGQACYIPVGHRSGGGSELALDGDGPTQLDRDEVLDVLAPVLSDPSILKIGQNIKYDLLVFQNAGLTVAPLDDTMLLSYVLDCGEHGHGMDELASIHLGRTLISFKDVAGSGKNQKTFDQIPLDKATDYAAEDADITLQLWRKLKPRLASEGMATVYATLERGMPTVLAAMEREGVKVDRSVLRQLSNDFAQKAADLESTIHEMAGEKFNIASPKQLGEILFDKQGLKGGKKTKTGAWSTNVEVLEALAAEGHDLPEKVLDWRSLEKLRSTYTDKLQQEINDRTGRVHTSYSLAATTTGRLSSNDPNLQNIPIRTENGRKIRKAFVAEDGNCLLAADYSQIELRILAHIADIDALKTAFRDGQDIHAMTASEVFGVPMEDMDPTVRRQAKAINFGIIYGISAYGLSRQLSIPRGEAKEYIDAYFERFPGIRAYMDDTIAFCKDKGYVETLFGRRTHVSAIKSKNQSERAFGERAAINAPIQGSAADIIRRAMMRMPAALADAGLDRVRMLLQVHDELVFEVPKGDVEAAGKVIRDVMEKACDPVLSLNVPLVVDIGVGANWDEAH